MNSVAAQSCYSWIEIDSNHLHNDFFTIGSSIYIITPVKKYEHFFFRSGDILTIGGSQFEQNIWAIVFCTLICPVI